MPWRALPRATPPCVSTGGAVNAVAGSAESNATLLVYWWSSECRGGLCREQRHVRVYWWGSECRGGLCREQRHSASLLVAQ
ncbi:hypothetical protein Aduo_015315 [Ancylostoma duodenale]